MTSTDYAADAAAVVAHLDLRDAAHIGHSTGGGEETHYVALHGKGCVAEVGTYRRRAANHAEDRRPTRGGLSIEVFDGLRQQLAAEPGAVHREFASGPFYSLQQAGARRCCRAWSKKLVASGHDGRRESTLRWRENLLGVRTLPEDLKNIDVLIFVLHGDGLTRSSRSLIFRAALPEAAKEGDSQGPPGGPSLHVYVRRRRGQFRTPRLH